MFETEVNSRSESGETLPAGVIEDLRRYRQQLLGRSVLAWGEHCTECVWPSCYSTCGLYEARADGGCRQFVGGVVRVPVPGASSPYLQKITFRRWAKLWAPGSTQCQDLTTVDRWEAVNEIVGRAARSVPLPVEIRHRALRKVAYLRKNRLVGAIGNGRVPDWFVSEIYNPNQAEVAITLTIRSTASRRQGAYQKLLRIPSGLHRDKVSYAEIAGAIDLSRGFEIELVPNEAENLTIYVGLTEFVQERETPREAPSASSRNDAIKCKCVIWDLDNTVWDGVLIEDGLERLRLREQAKAVMVALDERGILQSVASKNDESDVMEALRKFGIEEYLIQPQIGWHPKSQAIGRIAAALNVDPNTFVFVDDQEFERREVASAYPQVRCIDATHVDKMLDDSAFDVPITDESRRRRIMYREEQGRNALLASFGGDYLAFLRENRMEAVISPLTPENMLRVFELAQRTNQMNFSGNRYSLDELQVLASDGTRETFVIRCSDRFGTYGIVGFAVVDVGEPRLLDLMFSCRVQAKRVEHAVLGWLIGRYRSQGHGEFRANYRRTPKNKPSGAVFEDVGFEEVRVDSGISDLRFASDRELPVESIVQIRTE